MKKREVLTASAILGLAFGGIAGDLAADEVGMASPELFAAVNDLGSTGGPAMATAADTATASASGAPIQEAAATTGNTNTGTMSNAIVTAGTSPENAGTQFAADTGVLLEGGTQDPEGTANALTALTPDQISAMNVAATQQAQSGKDVAVSRMGGYRGQALAPGLAARATGAGSSAGGGASADVQLGDLAIFANIKYLNNQQDQNAYFTGHDERGTSFAFGGDYRFQRNLMLGVLGNYTRNSVDYARDKGSMDTDSWGLAVYGTYFWDRGAFVEGIAGYNRGEYDLDRRVRYSIALDGQPVRVDQRAMASPGGDAFHATLGGGYSFAYRSLAFTPQVSFNYLSNRVDSYRERMSDPGGPGGSLAFAVDEQTYTSTTSRLGFILANAMSTSRGVFVPQLSLDWVHEFANDQERIAAYFVNDRGNTPWALQTSEPDRDYLDLGIGLSGQFANGRSGFLSFNRLIGYEDLDSYAVTAGFRMEF